MIANAAQVLVLGFAFVLFFFCSPHGRIGESDLTSQLRRSRCGRFLTRAAGMPLLLTPNMIRNTIDACVSRPSSKECTSNCASPRSIMREKCTDGFTVVHPSDGLGEHVGDV